MSNSQSSGKDSHDLFREIDGLCDEIDNATTNDVHGARASEIQGVLKDQDFRDRAERKDQYTVLLSCRLIEVEIQPFESPRDRAFLTVRSSAGSFRHSIEVTECFAFIEFLLGHDFVIIATDKVRCDQERREDEVRMFTWLIFAKTSSHDPHKIKEG
jgi:hypothetical protein